MKQLCLLMVILGMWSSVVHAGSTSYYHPTTGEPLRWDTSRDDDEDGIPEIHYLVDAGGLGRLTHAQALQLLQAAMAIWEASANIEFVYDGDLPEEITADNYRDYLVVDETIINDTSEEIEAENTLQWERQTVIAFDNTEGSVILNDGDGIGGSGTQLGLTNITSITGSHADPQFITSAQIILNGSYIDGLSGIGDELTVNRMAAVMVHELGHLLGLDHSEAMGDLVYAVGRDVVSDPEFSRFVPTMASVLASEDQVTLNPDDISAIQALYPLDDSPFAQVNGEIRDATDAAFRGAAIELRKTDDPLCEVMSFVSGKQCTPLYFPGGDLLSGTAGSRCGDESTDTGNFHLRAIPAGEYILSVNEVIDEYKGGVIHPFSTEFPILELVGEAEFYNAGDAAGDLFSTRSTITVNDGEDIDDIDVVLSDSVADGDGEENLIAYTYYTTANGFGDSMAVVNSRCQPNTVDYAALIGVEEVVNTGGDDDDEPSTSNNGGGGCSLIAE